MFPFAFTNKKGENEELTLSKLVKAYADASGLEFEEVDYETLSKISDFERISKGYILAEGTKKHLNLEGFPIKLPSQDKPWTMKEVEQVWTHIEYLMKI